AGKESRSPTAEGSSTNNSWTDHPGLTLHLHSSMLQHCRQPAPSLRKHWEHRSKGKGPRVWRMGGSRKTAM
uniref:Uncharacterized protein n=1 Tax=Accipiter nisus TaxID=211598 RepID=A0A8B9MQ01_9AVES